MSGMRGYLRLYMLALAASVGLGVPVMAQDSSDLAAGQNAWNRAGCYNCHGSRAQGATVATTLWAPPSRPLRSTKRR